MSDVPVSVSGLTDAVSVTAGNGFACAVRRTGGVECWGDNSTGQLGDGGVESSSPVPVAVLGLSDATLVSSGTGFACARRSPGSVACWGDNTTGQLGDAGGEPMSYTPVSVHGLSDATQVSSGADAACSRRVTGGVACWGANTSGQLGNGTTATSFVPVLVTGLNDAAMVSAGSGFACAVRTGGGGACWGDDRVGQLGDGATHRMSMVPVTISGLAAATTVSAGGFGACAARTASLVCWGYGGSGALGDGSTTSSSVPVIVTGLNDAIQASAGDLFACAARSGGGVDCWGANGSGNLGDGHTDPTQAPVAVTGLADAKAVSAGTSASCAVRTGGGVVCWGDNSTGQLGDGGAEPPSSVPVSVSGLGDATHIAAGSDFACATRTGGGVACWGANTSGNLGFAGGNSFVPVAVGGLTDTSQISTGNGFACAVRTGGGVDCWGDNSTGQLGDGGAEPASAVPVAVSGLNDAAQISAGNGFACALRSGGAVRCWGDNSTGQLGNGTTIPSNVPVTVSGIVHATSIAAGDGFACATQTGGGALCWGDNTSGELGNGSTTSSTVPVSVSGLNDAKQVAATASARTTRAGFACAVRTGGGTACWGDNSAGELGNGAAWSDVPVTVAAPKAAIAPANTVPPSVLALTTPTVGGPLFCDAGVWSAPVASIGYVWLRNGTTIPGATSAVYTTTTYDTDTGLACRVTATNSAGSATATSDAVLVLASPPFNTAPPVIHSPTALLVGAVLSCTPGSWSDPAAIITYAWLRDGAPSSPRLVRPARSPRPIGAPPSPVK